MAMLTPSRMSRASRTLGAIVLFCGLLACPWAAAQGGSPPLDAESRFNTGVEHLRAGRVDLAIDEFQRAIKDDPKNPYFRKGLGLAYAQQKKYREAVESFEKALELNPYYVDVRNDLGTALMLQGKREDGKREFVKAFGEPTNPTPELSARNLGQAYFEEQNYEEALKWFQTAVKRNIKYSDAQLGLAESLLALNRSEEAVVQLEAANNYLPEDNGILLALGNAYFKVGRFTEARAKLERVARADPGGPAGRRAAELLANLPH